ncbi:uncharacterized protein LOC118417279 [Branchiostoma floridae]|uniref:Uncharacterized protein LOC118417279 n=1 Tax=Branchiostoma floridae TaxID=7739 RepID=A0A9J7L9F3_BRAFL|nr:uncharacterized protein LOC118417279 [Branchiostoma floridae]
MQCYRIGWTLHLHHVCRLMREVLQLNLKITISDDYSVASEFRCNHERQLKQKEKEEKASEVPTELELCLGKDSQEVHAPEMPTELEPVQDKGKGSQKRHHARHSVAADNPAQDGDHFSVSDRDGCPRVCVSGDRSLKTATLTKQPKKWRRC